jgi:hypothetical protein
VDPSANDNEAIRAACKENFEDIVSLLLKDPRVDPSARNNEAIRLAIEIGGERFSRLIKWWGTEDWAISESSTRHLCVVFLLLKDPRVDPSANDNEVIRRASYYGCINLIEFLLKDPRVDPSAQNSEAIRLASEQGHLEVVDVLSKDKRVDKSVLLSQITRK